MCDKFVSRANNKGYNASSDEKKLQFCSDAVKAITSVVIESKVKTTKAGLLFHFWIKKKLILYKT
jgi:hypothetical protein